jgi:hypothetical protein
LNLFNKLQKTYHRQWRNREAYAVEQLQTDGQHGQKSAPKRRGLIRYSITKYLQKVHLHFWVQDGPLDVHTGE